MQKDLTKTLLLKRSTKKKSGYSVSEEELGYFLETAPSKARVNPGDRVVGINGIPADDFLDEDDANGLIESIRIVVVPQDNLDEYDGIDQGDDSVEDEEDYEEYDRSRNVKPQPNGLKSIPQPNGLNVIPCDHCNYENKNLEPDEDDDLVCGECGHVIDHPSADENTIYKCMHCDYLNEDLEPDEDGDLVCEDCGNVMEPDVIQICEHCDHENKNLERDDEGDLVCQDCGHVIPEDSHVPEEDEQNPKKTVYECPDCEHKNINPVPDEEDDRVCEDCGCILPEKKIYECESCKHENIEPKKNKDGDYLCEHCESALDVDEGDRKTAAEKLKDINDDDSDASGGQQFDENGKPVTNSQGKKLTPADMFNPGDVITVTVGKSNPKQDPGLKVEENNGKYYVRKVPSGGLFARTPVIAGDKILELNGIDSREFKHVNEMKKILKDESRITVVVLRRDPDASESSASSVDYDELKAIKPPTKDDHDETRETEDDDTVPYDGEDCGCSWCPYCYE